VIEWAFWGLAGVLAALREAVEVSLLGLAVGVRLKSLAIRLPGLALGHDGPLPQSDRALAQLCAGATAAESHSASIRSTRSG